MRVYFRYAFRETFSNLWRNRLMSIAAILTVTVSLSLVGAALVTRQIAAQASVYYEAQTSVSVWMRPAATTTNIDFVKSQLSSSIYVSGTCRYLTKQDTYAQAKRQLTPGEFASLTLQAMPTVYICTPKVPTDAAILISSFKGQPGVLVVYAPVKEIQDRERAINIVKNVFLALAIILFVSSVVLIFNTIQLAIFARRREVTVMKLVGATNWFIRVPYITEGFIQGIVGSGIAVVVLSIVRALMPLPSFTQLSLNHFLVADLVVVLVGGLIGSFGSALAIRRFLNA